MDYHHSRNVFISYYPIKWVMIDKPKLCEYIVEVYLYINITII